MLLQKIDSPIVLYSTGLFNFGWIDRPTSPQVKIGIGKIAKSIRIGISILFLLEEKLGIGIGKGEIFKNGSRRISLALIWGQPQYQIYPNKKIDESVKEAPTWS